MSPIDYQCYGDYYQFGRGADGHQKIERGADGHITHISAITDKRALYINKAGSDFIVPKAGDYHNWLVRNSYSINDQRAFWKKTDGSSICPKSFRVPYLEELTAELLDDGNSAQVTNADDIYNTFLKLPASGYRFLYFNEFEDTAGQAAAVSHAGVKGKYWVLTYNNWPDSLDFDSDKVNDYYTAAYPSEGNSVRCIQKED